MKSHSTSVGYRIQARDTMFESTNKPTIIGESVICDKWVDLHFRLDQNPAGVPAVEYPGADSSIAYINHNLMPYMSAIALAHTVLAQLGHSSYRIQLRLVAYTVKVDISIGEKGVVDMVIDGEPFKSPKLVVKEEKEQHDANPEA